jgi:hypothetical protein
MMCGIPQTPERFVACARDRMAAAFDAPDDGHGLALGPSLLPLGDVEVRSLCVQVPCFDLSFAGAGMTA